MTMMNSESIRTYRYFVYTFTVRSIGDTDGVTVVATAKDLVIPSVVLTGNFHDLDILDYRITKAIETLIDCRRLELAMAARGPAFPGEARTPTDAERAMPKGPYGEPGHIGGRVVHLPGCEGPSCTCDFVESNN